MLWRPIPGRTDGRRLLLLRALCQWPTSPAEWKKKGTRRKLLTRSRREEETEGTNISRPRGETARSAAPVMLRGVRGVSLLTGKVHTQPSAHKIARRQNRRQKKWK
jgi:hypothetical protein